MTLISAEYQQVHATWERLSQDDHVGMSNAFEIVAAAANTAAGRQALEEILIDNSKVAIVEPDALSYLRIARDVPLPPGVENHRADEYFRKNLYAGTRFSKTHHLKIPKEFLYFNFAVGMITGTLDDLGIVRDQMRGSGYEPVLAHMPDGSKKAIGTVMVNDFRDTTFGPYQEVIFIVTAVPTETLDAALTVGYVNGFSLQVPFDRGATLYMLKMWLSELGPIEGGNEFLGTNKNLGSFVFTDNSNLTRDFRAVDKEGKLLVSGTIPRTLGQAGAEAAKAAYSTAAAQACTRIPSKTVVALAVASRPDEEYGKQARQWAITIDWRRPVTQELELQKVNLRFGESDWGRRFGGLGFTPRLAFWAPFCIGQIHQHIGDCPYVADGTG